MRNVINIGLISTQTLGRGASTPVRYTSVLFEEANK